MQILIFADIPTTDFDFPNIQPDLILLLGDISYRQILRIDRKYHCSKIGVFGNHDKPYFFDDTAIQNAHARILTMNGLTISGFQGSPKYNNKPFGQHTDEEVKAFTRTLHNQSIDIFISHSNPMYKDTQDDDTHKGFKAFNELLQKGSVRYFFHGHLHDPSHISVGEKQIYSVYPCLVVEI